jgi:hypothetical protein
MSEMLWFQDKALRGPDTMMREKKLSAADILCVAK